MPSVKRLEEGWSYPGWVFDVVVVVVVAAAAAGVVVVGLFMSWVLF
jgi:hypothetical protein